MSKFNEKRATTKKTSASTIKKTGASPKKTERRKSRENKKRQVNGKCETKSSKSAHDKQKYSYATSTKTPSVVFTTMTTVSKLNLIGAEPTTNTGVYHHPTQSIALDQYAVNSPRLALV